MSNKLSDFDYELPEELIAKFPALRRDESRLLVVNDNFDCTDGNFSDISKYLNAGDLLIFNDSKVLKARLLGNKPSGGKIEVMLERILDNNEIIAHLRSNKTINLGLEVLLANDLKLEVVEKLEGLFRLKIQNSNSTDFDWYSYLDEFGQLPLPPYMERSAQVSDEKSYQTVYAKHLGSVAAPTAGLHFTASLLDKIKSKGIKTAPVTLHVGSGTFKPVSVEDISKHKMHSERYSVPKATLELIMATKQSGGRIIAVGTTSIRVLESVARDNFKYLTGETDIFITPGFEFKIVDKLITNFHLPKSTLLMLVSAFAGFDTIKNAYTHAIDKQYRFFSYGDAMLLTRTDLIK